MHVVDELAAELQVERAAELGAALGDPLGLYAQVFVTIKSNAHESFLMCERAGSGRRVSSFFRTSISGLRFFCRTVWSPTIPLFHDKPFCAIRQGSPARSFHSEERAEGRDEMR